MNEMDITEAQWLFDTWVSENVAIRVVVDGVEMSVPLDPDNRHYAEIMRQVDAGTLTIADAE